MRNSIIRKTKETIHDFLKENPTRTHVTIDEFCGGRAPVRDPSEPPTPYEGPRLSQYATAKVFMELQTAGMLGRPFRPQAIPSDVARPNQYPVLRLPEG